MNRFQGRENMLHYCTTCFHPTKSLNSVNVSGFKVHEPEESCDSSNIQNDTYTGGNCLNIWALPNFSFFFGFLVLTLFIHPCLEAPVSSSAALTCSQQLWFLNTKELKKLSMKNTIFSSWAWVNYQSSITEHAACFFSSSVQMIILWTEHKDILILTCLFPRQRHVGFPTRPAHLGLSSMCLLEIFHEFLWEDFLNNALTDTDYYSLWARIS